MKTNHSARPNPRGAAALRSLVPQLLSTLMLALLVSPVQGAEEPVPQLTDLFPHRAGLIVEEAGMTRLDLPAAVIAACRQDLSDLRILSKQGQQIPFVLLPLESPQSQHEVLSGSLKILDVSRRERERRLAPTHFEEVFLLQAPPEAPQEVRWQILLTTRVPELVRRASVELLDDNGRVLAARFDQPLFRLASPRQERLSLDLPPPNQEGQRATKLRLTFAGEDSDFLNATFRYRSSKNTAEQGSEGLPLKIHTQSQEGSKTYLDLIRPPGVQLSTVQIHTDSRIFHRRVAVWDLGPHFVYRVAGGVFFRVPGETDLNELVLQSTTHEFRGNILRIEIDNGDAPPLTNLSASAEVSPRRLLFEAPAEWGPDGLIGELYFGGGQAQKPRYGLNTLLANPTQWEAAQGSPRAAIHRHFADNDRFPTARLTNPSPNPGFRKAPVAVPSYPGAELDPGNFAVRRLLKVPLIHPELARIRLTAEDLEEARDDLADLRIIDSERRQRAYLLERNGVSDLLRLSVKAEGIRDGRSKYSLLTSVPLSSADRLYVEIDREVFERPFVLRGIYEDDSKRTLAQGQLSRRAGDGIALEIHWSPSRGSRLSYLEMEIENGDDAPLPVVGATARLWLSELVAPLPPGIYHLLMGNEEAQAPRYEVEKMRDLLLALPITQVQPGPIESNPDLARWRPAWVRAKGQALVLWVVLVLAVVVLGTMTLRIAKG